MDHIKGLGLKCLLNGIPAVLILSTIGWLRLDESIITAVILTFIAYILGDLFVLPRSTSLIAAVADTTLVFLSLWLLRSLGLSVGWQGIALTALTLGLVEYLYFHPFLCRQVGRQRF